MKQEEIELNGNLYRMIESDGIIKLKRFNNKTKMWVKLNFNHTINNEVEKFTHDILKQSYIQNILLKTS